MIKTTYKLKFISSNNEKEIKINEKVIVKETDNTKSNEYIILSLVSSNNYDMREESGILCYYKLEDEHCDTILDEILEQIKDKIASEIYLIK